MSNLFDLTRGEVHFGGDIILRCGSTPQELVSVGLTFVREFDMKTGWVHRVAVPMAAAGHTIQSALGFHSNVLKGMSFAFIENPGLDLESLFNEHNAFLRQELGSPTTQNDRQSVYEYAWGEIVSENDPRGSGSCIWVSWR